MSTPTTAASWIWAPDALAFAAEQNVAQYLEPLLEVTRQLFPTALRLKVYVDEDPEIRDLRSIVFEPHVPAKDVSGFVESRHRWYRALRGFCPSPLVCTFGLFLCLEP